MFQTTNQLQKKKLSWNHQAAAEMSTAQRNTRPDHGRKSQMICVERGNENFNILAGQIPNEVNATVAAFLRSLSWLLFRMEPCNSALNCLGNPHRQWIVKVDIGLGMVDAVI